LSLATITASMTGSSSASLDGRIAPGRHHQRRGQRAQLHPDAGGKITPARRVGQVECQHQ
jgi:hypothetical protein